MRAAAAGRTAAREWAAIRASARGAAILVLATQVSRGTGQGEGEAAAMRRAGDGPTAGGEVATALSRLVRAAGPGREAMGYNDDKVAFVSGSHGGPVWRINALCLVALARCSLSLFAGLRPVS